MLFCMYVVSSISEIKNTKGYFDKKGIDYL